MRKAMLNETLVSILDVKFEVFFSVAKTYSPLAPYITSVCTIIILKFQLICHVLSKYQHVCSYFSTSGIAPFPAKIVLIIIVKYRRLSSTKC